MTTVVTTSPGFGKVGRVPEILEQNGWEFIRCIDTDLPDGGMSDYLDRMEYLVVGLVPARADVITNAPRLRAILKHGVAVDNIDIAAATARGIPVLNTAGAKSVEQMDLMVCEDIASLVNGGCPDRVINREVYDTSRSKQ
ncbi:MAG: hypothetical protein LUE17_07380 [Planctomycetaceae bacterium]|nr:hypothetical protein [Planctomycetaceae bacterium]